VAKNLGGDPGSGQLLQKRFGKTRCQNTGIGQKTDPGLALSGKTLKQVSRCITGKDQARWKVKRISHVFTCHPE
jgi:hypothetical protein